MYSISKQDYTLISPYSVTEVTDRLYRNTLWRKKLMKTSTDKAFIGEVTEDDFYLISSVRLGVLCTLNGQVENDGSQTLIKIQAKMHRAFLILFTCWALFVIIGSLIGYYSGPKQPGFLYQEFPVLLLIVAGCRYLLHYVYTKARFSAIKQLEEIIE